MFHKASFATFIIVAAMLLSAKFGYADGSLGVSYQQIIDDRSLGITGDYETQLADRVKFEVDGPTPSRRHLQRQNQHRFHI